MDRLPPKRSAACSSPSPWTGEAAATRSKDDDEAAGISAGTPSKIDSKYPPSVPRVYKRSDLGAFNLLANRPVWVFDVDRKAMWWANDAAMTLWNATSLDALLSRDFSDMSQASCKRLEEMMMKFRQGERVSDQVCIIQVYVPGGFSGSHSGFGIRYVCSHQS